VAHVHPAVQHCLDHMSRDPECSGQTALGDLLDIVRTKLLIVDLPKTSESTLGNVMPNVLITNTDDNTQSHQPFGDDNTQRRQPFGRQRASAAAFVQALDDILQHENESYWFTGQSRQNIHLPRYTPHNKSDNASLQPPSRWGRQPGSMVDRTRAHISPSMPAALLKVPGQNQNVRAQ
jgi:hypothetical protein